MRYVIHAIPEDPDDLDHPLAGAWEIRPVEPDPGPPELVLIDGYKGDL